MPPAGKPKSGENEYLLDFEKPLARLNRLIADLEAEQTNTGRDHNSEIRKLRAQYLQLLRKTYSNLSPWETVQVARHPRRPLACDYIDRIVKDFVELHGDRAYADDRALRTGLGRINTEKVVIVAQHKGRDTKEKIACNFGMPHPEGYRKALRAMQLAQKFGLPVVCWVDTPGAYPGVGSEERGVAEAIAVNLREMSRLKVPIVVTILGEGGSGGALGIGVGDRMAMLEHSYYSVISPEGCAAILWKTGAKAKEAAEAMKITSPHLKKLDIIDDVVTEPLGGAHRNAAEAASYLERYLVRALRELKAQPLATLLDNRYKRWRRMGQYIQVPAATAAAPLA
jgi:acetyl-CoA carboxylase carboxyl transferase subunit alpha